MIDRGDILLPQKRYLSEPVSLTVERGYVTAIEGGLEGELFREYMESFQDPEGYALSHIGWGLQQRAKWTTLSLYDREQTIAMEARAFAGNFLFSLGPNTEVGGTRNTACHIDIPLHRRRRRPGGRARWCPDGLIRETHDDDIADSERPIGHRRRGSGETATVGPTRGSWAHGYEIRLRHRRL